MTLHEHKPRQDADGIAAQSGKATASPDEASKSRQLWTCPMHPQILRDGPGSCPICGMALEPLTPMAEEPENPELIAMTRRFWTGVVLSLPLLLLATADDLLGGPVSRALSPAGSLWLQAALATPVVLWGGWPFFQRGWQSVVNRSLNMFTLIALGTGIAYAYSVIALLLPGIFPDSFRGMHGGCPSISRRHR
jgi:Cu+-exporting ATPase